METLKENTDVPELQGPVHYICKAVIKTGRRELTVFVFCIYNGVHTSDTPRENGSCSSVLQSSNLIRYCFSSQITSIAVNEN